MAFICRAKEKNWKLPIIKFQWWLLGISWKDKVRNEEVRQWTNLKEMNLIIKWRELRWLGHVLHMEDNKIPKQAMYWQMYQHVKRKPGRPRKNWIDTICQDLKTIGMAWEEAEESAANRED